MSPKRPFGARSKVYVSTRYTSARPVVFRWAYLARIRGRPNPAVTYRQKTPLITGVKALALLTRSRNSTIAIGAYRLHRHGGKAP